MKAMCGAGLPLNPQNVVVPPEGAKLFTELNDTHKQVNDLQDAIDEAEQRLSTLRSCIEEAEKKNAKPTSHPPLSRLMDDKRKIKEAGDQILMQLQERLECIVEEAALLQGLADFCTDD